MKPGEQPRSPATSSTFDGVAPATGPELSRGDRRCSTCARRRAVGGSSRRRAHLRRAAEPTTEAGIHVAWRGDLYVVLGDKQNAGGYASASTSIRSCAASGSARWSMFARRRRLADATGGCASARRAAPAAPPPPPPNESGRTCSRRSCAGHRLLAAGGAGGPARRDPARSGARGAGARDLRGPALPRLPEPVDRRFQRPLGRDLRLLVRERLKAGDSDAQVVDFVVDRYGEFVLLRPPFSWRTVLLWLAPILALIVAVWMTAQAWRRRQLRRRTGEAAAPLSGRGREAARDLSRERGAEPAPTGSVAPPSRRAFHSRNFPGHDAGSRRRGRAAPAGSRAP